MNEPAVFGGVESSLSKNCIHDIDNKEISHLQVHNTYGYYYMLATFHAKIGQFPSTRPFILTRSFFAGMQKYGAMWTGDNNASWSDLKVSVSMMMSLAACGISFCGSDIGGFFGHPSDQLLVRFHQVGAFNPFCRSHCIHHSPHREPYLYSGEIGDSIRSSIVGRYVLLPYIYTVFNRWVKTGEPMIQPMFFQFLDTVSLQEETKDMFLLGRSMIVHAVTEADCQQVTSILPVHQYYFDHNYEIIHPDQNGQYTSSTPLSHIPVFYIPGHILITHTVIGKSSKECRENPYQMLIFCDQNGYATGDLYLDSGDEFPVVEDNTLQCTFYYQGNALKNMLLQNGYHKNCCIESILIFGENLELSEAENEKWMIKKQGNNGYKIQLLESARMDSEWELLF